MSRVAESKLLLSARKSKTVKLVQPSVEQFREYNVGMGCGCNSFGLMGSGFRVGISGQGSEVGAFLLLPRLASRWCKESQLKCDSRKESHSKM